MALPLDNQQERARLVHRPSELPPSASSFVSNRQGDQADHIHVHEIRCSQEEFRAVLALATNPHPWSLLFC